MSAGEEFLSSQPAAKDRLSRWDIIGKGGHHGIPFAEVPAEWLEWIEAEPKAQYYMSEVMPFARNGRLVLRRGRYVRGSNILVQDARLVLPDVVAVATAYANHRGEFYTTVWYFYVDGEGEGRTFTKATAQHRRVRKYFDALRSLRALA